ncbi:MAG: type II toxin-antitoxin system HicA family toxin [Nitrososphaerales archaeon]
MSLRPIPAEKLIKALAKVGFKPVRQRGSHLILKHNDGRVTIVPVHRGEEVGRGLLSKIINDAGLTREEFLKLLKEI